MNPKRLHPVVHRDGERPNKWCGPVAVAILTGRSPECAAEWIAASRKLWGHRERTVRGTSSPEVRGAIDRLGYFTHLDVSNPRYRAKTPTLARWLRERTKLERRRTYLVEAGDHWIVVRGNRAGCSLTGGPVATSRCKMRRARVRRVWVVTEGTSDAARSMRRRRGDPSPEAFP